VQELLGSVERQPEPGDHELLATTARREAPLTTVQELLGSVERQPEPGDHELLATTTPREALFIAEQEPPGSVERQPEPGDRELLATTTPREALLTTVQELLGSVEFRPEPGKRELPREVVRLPNDGSAVPISNRDGVHESRLSAFRPSQTAASMPETMRMAVEQVVHTSVVGELEIQTVSETAASSRNLGNEVSLGTESPVNEYPGAAVEEVAELTPQPAAQRGARHSRFAEVKTTVALGQDVQMADGTIPVTEGETVLPRAMARRADTGLAGQTTPVDRSGRGVLDATRVRTLQSQPAEARPSETGFNLPPSMIQEQAVDVVEIQSFEPARLAEAQHSEVIDQITQRITSLGNNSSSEFKIQLFPENLGRIDLYLSKGADGMAQMVFGSP